MSRTPIRVRLIVTNPVPGVAYSLQDKKSAPVGTRISPHGEALSFDFSIEVAPGPKFFGQQVRAEGPERRFVYLASGAQAGAHGTPWSRRMKLDIHRLPQALLDGALAGKVLTGTVEGTAKDGGPACATVPVDWRLD